MRRLKTFMELLKEQDSDQLIYVGTQSGRNWIVIDTAENIIKNIHKLEKYLRSYVERVDRKAQSRLDTLPFEIVDIHKQMDELLESKHGNAKYHGLRCTLDSLEKQFVKAYSEREKCNRVLKEWKEVGDRIVVETRMHESDYEGLAFVLEGFEPGQIFYKGEKKSIFKTIK